MTTTTEVTTRSYFRSLVILHIALIAGQVIFGMTGFMVKLVSQDAVSDKTLVCSPEVYPGIQYLILALALLGLGASWLLFSSRLRILKGLSSPAEQYKGYRSACILRYALLEGPSLIALVLFLVTGDYLLLAVPAFIILVFIMIRPTKATLMQHLQPAYDQQMLLDDPDAVLYDDQVSGSH